MFTPPADDVKPIPVPDEIYTQCITDAARFFGIDAELVFTLFDNEGGKVGTFSRNT
ncbi:lytic transglycosylase domain-containing protein, partial [Salmonella enterica subsp. enterica serovar Anatum]